MRSRIIRLAFVSLLTGCLPNKQADPDPIYDRLQTLNFGEAMATFKSLPLTERLRLYNKFYDRPLYPHDTQFSHGFPDKPYETLDLIISEIEASPNKIKLYYRYDSIIFPLVKQIGPSSCHSYVRYFGQIIETVDDPEIRKINQETLECDICRNPIKKCVDLLE